MIVDGEWIANEDMGWWGMTSNPKGGEREWNATVRKALDAADPESLIVMLDCHI